MLQAFELIIIVAVVGVIASLCGLAALLVIPAIFGSK
jgi:hypothetical protein